LLVCCRRGDVVVCPDSVLRDVRGLFVGVGVRGQVARITAYANHPHGNVRPANSRLIGGTGLDDKAVAGLH
jgi:hypothetical protein